MPDESWCLFRGFAEGRAPSPSALDNRRVAVGIGEATLADASTGRRRTSKASSRAPAACAA